MPSVATTLEIGCGRFGRVVALEHAAPVEPALVGPARVLGVQVDARHPGGDAPRRRRPVDPGRARCSGCSPRSPAPVAGTAGRSPSRSKMTVAGRSLASSRAAGRRWRARRPGHGAVWHMNDLTGEQRACLRGVEGHQGHIVADVLQPGAELVELGQVAPAGERPAACWSVPCRVRRGSDGALRRSFPLMVGRLGAGPGGQVVWVAGYTPERARARRGSCAGR